MMHLQTWARAAAITTVLLPIASTQDVEFFYTGTVDLCSIEQSSMQANEQTTHGGVCAYRPDVARVYGCPAPDPTCWTWYEDCTATTVGQTVCNRDGTVWCCNAVAGETCTTTAGQINVCISNFTSPNSGVSIDDANAAYLSALGVSTVIATTQTLDPTPFSTRNLAATASPSSSLSSSSSSFASTAIASTTLIDTSTASSASTSATGSSAANDTPTVSNSSGSGLSGGAIAGIVIGALAVLAIIGAGFFLLGRRRRNNKSDPSTSESKYEGMSSPPMTGGGAYTSTQEKHRYGGPEYPIPELGSDGNGRAEMPVSYESGQPPIRHEMG